MAVKKGPLTAVDGEKVEATSPDPVPLAEAAQNALAEMAEGDGSQPAFDGMEDVTKIKFVGLAFDSIEDRIQLGDEVSFLVRARCTAETKEVLKDGLLRNVRKMDVQSVVIK